MNVNLHIERLVLDGVNVRDPTRLETTVVAELTRLLGGTGTWPHARFGGGVHAVRAGTIELGTNAAMSGSRIGRAVHSARVGAP